MKVSTLERLLAKIGGQLEPKDGEYQFFDFSIGKKKYRAYLDAEMNEIDFFFREFYYDYSDQQSRGTFFRTFSAVLKDAEVPVSKIQMEIKKGSELVWGMPA
jgi:hypothetical protein